MQTVRQTCNGIRVTDIALSFSGWDRPQAGAGDTRPKFEGTVYLVWKRKD
jgi:nicotinamide mononucleotide (NMN) deamidase PncC